MVANSTPPVGDDGALRRTARLDVSGAMPGEVRLEIAADLVLPAQGAPRALLVCLPGGFLSRRYWDLENDGDRCFSMAGAMARRGFASLCLDHLGIGESTRPADGWALDADLVALGNELAIVEARREWSDVLGPALPSIGVGHSMGSCLTVVQQANHGTHRALVLQTFATRGLRDFLQGREGDLDPDIARANVRELAQERFGAPFPGDVMDAGHTAFSVGTAPPEAARALQEAATGVLPIPALLSMLPRGYAPWAERIETPAFVSVADHDLHSLSVVASSLPKAARLDTYVVEDGWHCHNVANTREALWERTAGWIDDVLVATN